MRETLSAIPGVKKADVHFDIKEADVTYDNSKVTIGEIIKQLGDKTEKQYKAQVK